jgi:hypothetical protein
MEMKVKFLLAEKIAEFTGDLIVVIIKEMAGAPGVRHDMLNYQRGVAEALRDLRQPMRAHCKP